jgi:uncharacterized protein (TIGR03382 family)
LVWRAPLVAVAKRIGPGGVAGWAGAVAATATSLSHAAITQVHNSTVVANTTEDLSGFASGGNAARDGVVQGNGVAFGERFAGQQLSSQSVYFPAVNFNSQFDTLSGSPTSPLTLLAGSANHNLWIGDVGLPGGFMMAGCGPAGSAFGSSGNGHGSVALLFDEDQSQLGFQIFGQNGSIGVVSFFRRDGSLIETVNIDLAGLQTGGIVPELSFGFLRDGGVADIAGMSFTNVDLMGVAMDNFIFSNSIPAPGAVALLGLAGLVGGRRRRA